MENEKQVFNSYDIEDTIIIIKAKGKHYFIVPKGDKEEARQLRIAFCLVLLKDHYVVNVPLEDSKK